MDRNRRLTLAAGALLAAAGVGFGAFGAHSLRDVLGVRELAVWQTAVDYQMWHAVALVALAAIPLHRLAAALLAFGTMIFLRQPLRTGARRAEVAGHDHSPRGGH